MLKISKELDLALLLMGELKQNEPLSLSAWAAEKQLPYRFLCKIANKLKKVKLIASQEGRSGGYKLGRSGKEIKIKDIFQAIEGKIAPVVCLQGKKCKAEKYCRQRNLLTKLCRVIDQQLNKLSLETLCH